MYLVHAKNAETDQLICTFVNRLSLHREYNLSVVSEVRAMSGYKDLFVSDLFGNPKDGLCCYAGRIFQRFHTP